MTGFEVKNPILNSPFEEPMSYWQIEEGMPRRARLDALSTSHYDRPNFS